jgi:Protein of unknown function (DUF3592)
VNSGATAPSGPARARLGFGTILWALIPLLSLGLLAPVPFAVAAVRLRQRRLWVVTAAYAIGSALLIVGAFSPQGGWGEVLVATVGLVLMVAGTAHAFLLRGRVFAPSLTRTTMKPRWLPLVASIGVLLLGVGLVAAGAQELVDNLRPPSAASRRADGVVIRVESVTTGSGSDRHTTYQPVVRFLTEREQVIVFTSNSGSSHSAGDRVKVRYDPKQSASGTAGLAGGSGVGGGRGRRPASWGSWRHGWGWRAVRVGFDGFPPVALGVDGEAGVPVTVVSLRREDGRRRAARRLALSHHQPRAFTQHPRERQSGDVTVLAVAARTS